MGSSGKGLTQATTSGEQTSVNALNSLAQTQSANSNSLFNTALPDYQAASNFNQTLSTGDPYAISRLAAPADQQIASATAGAKQNILQNAPAGGERNLALEQADVNQGAQTGAVASQGYLNSFNSLAQLGTTGTGLANSAASTGIGALGTGLSGYNQIANQGIEQKGASLGALGALAGDVTGVASGGITNASGKGGAAANPTAWLSGVQGNNSTMPITATPSAGYL